MSANMNHRIHCCLISTLFIISVKCLKIDDKLDFDAKPQPQSEILSQYQTKTIENSGNFDKFNVPIKTSVVKTDGSKGSEIEADIVVHVKTKVQVQESNKNNTNNNYNTDIPIIIGTAGVKTHPQRKYTTTNQFQPNVVTNIETLFPPNIQTSSNSVANRQYRPDVGADRQFKTIMYDLSGLQGIQVPYFEPSYHTHHFGEQQPSIGWYPGSKSTWQPSHWPKERQHKHNGGGSVCNCYQERGINREGKHQRQFGLVGIDDKLGSLE